MVQQKLNRTKRRRLTRLSRKRKIMDQLEKKQLMEQRLKIIKSKLKIYHHYSNLPYKSLSQHCAGHRSHMNLVLFMCTPCSKMVVKLTFFVSMLISTLCLNCQMCRFQTNLNLKMKYQGEAIEKAKEYDLISTILELGVWSSMPNTSNQS